MVEAEEGDGGDGLRAAASNGDDEDQLVLDREAAQEGLQGSPPARGLREIDATGHRVRFTHLYVELIGEKRLDYGLIVENPTLACSILRYAIINEMKIVTTVCFIAVLPVICSSQSLRELQSLLVPRSLDLSPDGSRLWYKIGHQWWVIGTTPNSKPARAGTHRTAEAQKLPEVEGTGRLTNVRRSPDGKRIAYLDAENPTGSLLLFCQCGQAGDDKRRPVSRMAIEAFQWAKDSNSFWVLANDGADQPIGHLRLDGTFEPVSQGAAIRSLGGLAAAHDMVAWVQSDGSDHGTICISNQGGTPRILFDPNPQTTKWSEAWSQEAVRWKNTHGEELQGILAVPAGGRHLPMIIDPYSNWQNRFLNIGVLGNYMFVKAGFAVFFPDHRAAHIQPERAFGEGYTGASKKRDTVDVLTDDVMTGVWELVRRGVADSGPIIPLQLE